MAGTITLTASLSCTEIPPQIAPVARNIANFPYPMAGSLYTQGVVLAPITTGVAIPLGQVSNLGWGVLYNSDAVNSIIISNGLSGAAVLQLPPGGFNVVTFLPACVPFMVALVAPCNLEYLIFAR